MSIFSHALAAALAFAFAAHANCGLDHCPRLTHDESPLNHSASLQLKHVAFTLDSGSGVYRQALARYEYTGIDNWMMGGNLPVIALTTHSETHYGISNPLLYASWYGHFNQRWTVYVGTQLELPFGNADEGMASDHLMLVPYVQIEQFFGTGYVLGSLGYSRAFSLHEHEEGEEHPLFVNPHEDQELLYRFGTGFKLWGDGLTSEVSINGRHVLVDELEGAGRNHVAGSITVSYDLGRNLTLSPSAEMPLNSPRRFDWSAGLEIKSLF